jgi:hypothetical protein
MEVQSIRYFETNRGIGYEAKTKCGSILNDGNGGATYFIGDTPEANKKYRDISECDLEEMIDTYEFIERCKITS